MESGPDQCSAPGIAPWPDSALELGEGMVDEALISTLPTEQRLALAYAPAASRSRFLATLALDARLAAITREGREPALMQLRMAWWREKLEQAGPGRRSPEPLLDIVASSFAEPAELVALVDGWECLAAGQTSGRRLAELVAARAAVLARCGSAYRSVEAERAGREWAVADLAARLNETGLRAEALELVQGCTWHRCRLPLDMRPLAVLHALARSSHSGDPLLGGPGAFLRAIRVGLFGT